MGYTDGEWETKEAELKDQLDQMTRERDQWKRMWEEDRGGLKAENRLLLENWYSCAEMLGLEPKDIAPLTTAEVERVKRLERKVTLLNQAWATLAEDAEWECDCAVCAEIRALAELEAG